MLLDDNASLASALDTYLETLSRDTRSAAPCFGAPCAECDRHARLSGSHDEPIGSGGIQPLLYYRISFTLVPVVTAVDNLYMR